MIKFILLDDNYIIASIFSAFAHSGISVYVFTYFDAL